MSKFKIYEEQSIVMDIIVIPAQPLTRIQIKGKDEIYWVHAWIIKFNQQAEPIVTSATVLQPTELSQVKSLDNIHTWRKYIVLHEIA